MKFYVLIIGLVLIMSGCVQTRFSHFTDPDFKNKKFTAVLVSSSLSNYDNSANLETAVCDLFKHEGINCFPSFNVFPPTRDFSNDDKFRILKENNIDAHLLISNTGGNLVSEFGGMYSFGSVNLSGNTAYGQGYSIAVNRRTRKEEYAVVLVDVASKRKAWIGGANSEGRGRAGTSDDSMLYSFSGELLRTLKEAGHF